MKPIIKKLWIFFACFAVTAAAFLLLRGVISYAEQLPAGIMLSSAYGINLSFKDCDSEDMPVAVSGEIIKTGYVTSEFSTAVYPVQAKLNYTNESYDEIVPFAFLYGGYFGQSRVKEGNRYVVISDALSMTLFKEYDSVGQQISVNGEHYSVCGVYCEPRNFLREISSDGLERIYLSYSNLAAFETAAIPTLYIKGGHTFSDDSLVAQVQLAQNPPVIYDDATNFYDSARVIKQTAAVAFFIFGINAAAAFVYVFLKKSKEAYFVLKSERTDKIRKLKSLLPPTVCAAGAGIVLWIFKFDLYIPTKMLPPDNVFDLSFYLKNAAAFAQAHNQLGAYSFYWNYSAAIMIAAIAAAALLTVMLIVTWWYGITKLFSIMQKR